MAIPKQRGSGQFGGDRHRSNKGAFRASGGNVKPPGKGCAITAIMALVLPVALVAGVIEIL